MSEMMTEVSKGRLFVPLSSEPYSWFLSGEKRWELRRYGRQYTVAHVREGRQVELRLGYRSQQQSLWGHIVRTVEANSLDSFFKEVPFRLVIPIAKRIPLARAAEAQTLAEKGHPGGKVLLSGGGLTSAEIYDPAEAVPPSAPATFTVAPARRSSDARRWAGWFANESKASTVRTERRCLAAANRELQWLAPPGR